MVDALNELKAMKPVDENRPKVNNRSNAPVVDEYAAQGLDKQMVEGRANLRPAGRTETRTEKGL